MTSMTSGFVALVVSNTFLLSTVILYFDRRQWCFVVAKLCRKLSRDK